MTARPTKKVRRKLARYYRQRKRRHEAWFRDDESGHARGFRHAAARYWLARLSGYHPSAGPPPVI